MVNKKTRPPIPTRLFIVVSSGVCPVPRILELIADRQIKIPEHYVLGDTVFIPGCQAPDPRGADTYFVMGRSSDFRFVLFADLPINE